MKKIVSRILIGILIFILLLSIVTPAFAASGEVDMQSTSEPVEPVCIVLAIIALGAIPAASFSTLKFANEWRYRNRAERLIRENMPYVKLTGLPLNEIRNHFAKFANRNGHIRNMNNHFLEELYAYHNNNDCYKFRQTLVGNRRAICCNLRSRLPLSFGIFHIGIQHNKWHLQEILHHVYFAMSTSFLECMVLKNGLFCT